MLAPFFELCSDRLTPLAAASSVADTDLLYVVSGGAGYRCTRSQILTAATPGSGAGNSITLAASAAVSGNTNGGNVVLKPAAKSGSGSDGYVEILQPGQSSGSTSALRAYYDGSNAQIAAGAGGIVLSRTGGVMTTFNNNGTVTTSGGASQRFDCGSLVALAADGAGVELISTFGLRWSDSAAAWSSGSKVLGLFREGDGIAQLTTGARNGAYAALRIGQPTTTTVGLTVKAIASSTAKIIDWRDSSDTVLGSIGADGKIYCGQFGAYLSGNVLVADAGNTLQLNPYSGGGLYVLSLGAGISVVQYPLGFPTGNPILKVIGGAVTALTASTEAPDIWFSLGRTATWATGNITTQRAVRIDAPTYAFAGVSTITTASTVAISNCPQIGTNATLTTSHALSVTAQANGSAATNTRAIYAECLDGSGGQQHTAVYGKVTEVEYQQAGVVGYIRPASSNSQAAVGVCGAYDTSSSTSGSVVGVQGLINRYNANVGLNTVGVLGETTIHSATGSSFGVFALLDVNGHSAGIIETTFATTWTGLSAQAALGASNGTTTADIARLYDNTTLVLQLTDGGGIQHTLNSTTAKIVNKAAASHSSNVEEWQDSSGTVMSAIAKNGAFKPASLADSAAENNTIYYSTDASKLVYKDSGGVVNNLY